MPDRWSTTFCACSQISDDVTRGPAHELFACAFRHHSSYEIIYRERRNLGHRELFELQNCRAFLANSKH